MHHTYLYPNQGTTQGLGIDGFCGETCVRLVKPLPRGIPPTIFHKAFPSRQDSAYASFIENETLTAALIAL